ncbi:MAG: energy transducer TonB [Mucilaginibacter sp.]|jgi:protein TonB|uniref:energy transducer TonB n=1 Tax=Mucilaginibacter sp. TaxID=1882438 RepID=UPI0035631E74
MKKILLLFIIVMTTITVKAQVTDTTKADTQKNTLVRVAPSVVGGLEKYYKYVEKNLKYPKAAIKNKIEGQVVLTFIIERDGSFTNINVAKSLSPETDSAAIRLISDPKAPKWTPGIQNGKPVRVQYSLPFFFKKNR